MSFVIILLLNGAPGSVAKIWFFRKIQFLLENRQTALPKCLTINDRAFLQNRESEGFFRKIEKLQHFLSNRNMYPKLLGQSGTAIPASWLVTSPPLQINTIHGDINNCEIIRENKDA
jgi:hypothetical protein